MAFIDKLDQHLVDFIDRQHIFFTGTAPENGRVNVSPKGMDTFRCFDFKTVGYLDLTGSGNETAAHVFENSRMTIMFCSFEKDPLILRLYGEGEVIQKNSDKWNDLINQYPDYAGQRQIILLHIKSVQTSCGYSIPFMEYKSERTQLNEGWLKKGRRRNSGLSKKEESKKYR